jgi:chorismate dehydratase
VQTRIRVGAVSYLNTKPLIYGFEMGMMKERVDLIIDYPSKIASMLLKNEIDVGLVPVAIIPEMREYHIISDFCIGSDGEVASVCLFSEVPLDKIEKILLDYQSRTSVALLKVLVREYWKLDVQFENTSGEYQPGISGTTAGLIIGDRALRQRKISPYIYDLGAEWKKFTGFPFVFAAWISNKELNKNFMQAFDEANKFGLTHLDEVIKQINYFGFNLHEYYTTFIKFYLDEDKLKGLNDFLQKTKM